MEKNQNENIIPKDESFNEKIVFEESNNNHFIVLEESIKHDEKKSNEDKNKNIRRKSDPVPIPVCKIYKD
jgi:hypothetical protein